ncbi:MAG: GGDEF domain-containing protein [Planctomycetaceae bacterium]
MISHHRGQSVTMPYPTAISTDNAVLTAVPDAIEGAPLTVHRDTILGDIPSRGCHEYVLVCNDEQQIVGVVPSREIDRRLISTNRFERTRWHAMPVGAMLNMSLARHTGAGPSFQQGELKCATICEDGQLFGLSVDGDLFLSWRRLESMFTAALSDPLTGLMNRLAYERRLSEEWNRSQRTGNSIGVVVVDLDDFKHVNDTYGHVVGDEVLSRVGRQLEASMRSYDVVARFGGDEFVALCLGCGPDAIEIPVKRLLDSLAEIQMDVNGQTIRVAASIGAAVRHSGFADSEPEHLFVAADKCLYESKRSSSNSWKIEFGVGMDSFAKPVVPRATGDPKRLALTTES